MFYDGVYIAQCVVLPYITVRARKRLVLAKILLQEALMLSLLLLLSGDIGNILWLYLLWIHLEVRWFLKLFYELCFYFRQNR